MQPSFEQPYGGLALALAVKLLRLPEQPALDLKARLGGIRRTRRNADVRAGAAGAEQKHGQPNQRSQSCNRPGAPTMGRPFHGVAEMDGNRGL